MSWASWHYYWTHLDTLHPCVHMFVGAGWVFLQHTDLHVRACHAFHEPQTSSRASWTKAAIEPATAAASLGDGWTSHHLGIHLVFQSQGAKCSQEGCPALEVTQKVPVPTSAWKGFSRLSHMGWIPRNCGLNPRVEPGSAHTSMGVYLPLASLRDVITNAYKTLWYPMMKGAIQEHCIIITHTMNLWEHAKIFIAKGTFKYLRVPLKGKILQDDCGAWGCLTTSRLLVAT